MSGRLFWFEIEISFDDLPNSPTVFIPTLPTFVAYKTFKTIDRYDKQSYNMAVGLISQ